MFRSFLLAAALAMSGVCIGSAAFAEVIDSQCRPQEGSTAGSRTLAHRIVGAWRLAQMYEENEHSDDIDILGPDPQGHYRDRERAIFYPSL